MTRNQLSIREFLEKLQKYDAHESIDVLLMNSEVQEFLSEIYKGLSPGARAATRNWIQPSSDGSSKEREPAAIATLGKVKEIALHAEISDLFNKCLNSPNNFWTILQAHSPRSITDITDLYQNVRNLSLLRNWNTIQWRYYTLFFYDLAMLIGDGTERITEKRLSGLLHVLNVSESIEDKPDNIKKNVLRWCQAGSRYNKICHNLDNGALFLLPEETEKLWESENLLPVKWLDVAIESLSKLGICELSTKIGADTLGTKIRWGILEPFRWKIPEYKPRDERTRSQVKSTNKVVKTKGNVKSRKARGRKKPQDGLKQTQDASRFESQTLSSDHQIPTPPAQAHGIAESEASANGGDSQAANLTTPRVDDNQNNLSDHPSQAHELERSEEPQFTNQNAAANSACLENSGSYADVLGVPFLPSFSIPIGSQSRFNIQSNSGQENLGLANAWPLISDEFINERPNNGQENLGLGNGWPLIPEDFIIGRLDIGQENLGLGNSWPLIPEDFIIGRLDIGQENLHFGNT